MENSNLKSQELVNKLQSFVKLKRLDRKCIFCLEEIGKRDSVEIKEVGDAHEGCFELYGDDARHANSLLRGDCLEEFHQYFNVCRNMSKEGIQVLGEAYHNLN